LWRFGSTAAAAVLIFLLLPVHSQVHRSDARSPHPRMEDAISPRQRVCAVRIAQGLYGSPRRRDLDLLVKVF
jgi:hypothetical protein